MIGIGLRRLQCSVRGNINLDLKQIVAEVPQYAKRLFYREGNFRIEILVEEFSGHANPQWRQSFRDSSEVVTNRRVYAVLVVPCDCLQHDCGIRNRARNRADVIERRRERDYPTRADSSVSWLQSHNSAKRSRFANRTGSIGSNRAVTQASGHRCSRASR